MAMYKQVNGKRVKMTPEEEQVEINSRIPSESQLITNSKTTRNELLESNTVEIREGLFIKTRKKDYANLKELINDLQPTDVYPNFTQRDPEGNTQVFDVTGEEVESAFLIGKLQAKDYHQAHALRVKEIQSNS